MTNNTSVGAKRNSWDFEFTAEELTPFVNKIITRLENDLFLLNKNANDLYNEDTITKIQALNEKIKEYKTFIFLFSREPYKVLRLGFGDINYFELVD